MALHRCLVCGHTDDLSLTNFVCPSCNTQLTLIRGEIGMSISLCGPGIKHVWRYKDKGQWQCEDCKLIVLGRRPTVDELERIHRGEFLIELNTEIP